ncbi:MAG: hypothetical protein J3R72DRAFT_492583 [Linnemannia gamsii]|nr:MAG: hypothetical protein J3R72DRAFT_492583 [Linnemannia gamsii]
MLQQPRRLARSGVKRGPIPQPRPDQRVFRAQTPRQQRFWNGKLPILLGLAVLMLGYRIMRQETSDTAADWDRPTIGSRSEDLQQIWRLTPHYDIAGAVCSYNKTGTTSGADH